VKLGRVVAESKELALPPEEVAVRFDSAGVSEILLLSLDRVGTAAGPDCSTLSRVLPRIAAPVLVGGGIRSVEDIYLLRELGCAGVLIATALHTGRITREDVVQIMQSR
jgi:phosphoribosylformimino-5-aminoimidazole carboxamide ribotide isomerase